MADEMTERDVMRDTLKHVYRVQDFLMVAQRVLVERIAGHDRSKFSPEEFDAFVVASPKLKHLTYGSSEYKASLDSIKPALDHHYAYSRHHIEHFPEGIRGMNLVDLLEMICDWRAATERHADGDIRSSIEKNQDRFGYSDDVKALLYNTVDLIEDYDRG